MSILCYCIELIISAPVGEVLLVCQHETRRRRVVTIATNIPQGLIYSDLEIRHAVLLNVKYFKT